MAGLLDMFLKKGERLDPNKTINRRMKKAGLPLNSEPTENKPIMIGTTNSQRITAQIAARRAARKAANKQNNK